VLILVFVMILAAGIPIGYGANSQTTSLEVLSRIKLDKEPRCIAVNEVTNRIYVGIEGGIVVINGSTLQILATIQLDSSPNWIIADARNNHIIVSGYNVSVFDGATNSKIGTLSNSGNDKSQVDSDEIVLDSKRNLIYTALATTTYPSDERIRVYNATTLIELTPIILSGTSGGLYVSDLSIAIDTELNRIYVEWLYNDTIFLIDGSTHAILKTNNFTSYYNLAGYNPLTNRVYFEYNRAIDGTTLKEIPTPSIFGIEAFDPVLPIIYGQSQIFDAFTGESLAQFDTSQYGGIAILHAINTRTGILYIEAWPNNETLAVQGPTATKPLLITGLSVNPQFQVEAGNSVTISYKVRNLSNSSVTYTPSVDVGPIELTQGQVQRASGENRTFQFSLSMSTVGYYTVIAENLSTGFQVQDTKPPSTCNPDDGISGWSNNSTPTFRWSAAVDNGSGVAGYYYRVDNGQENWTTSINVTLPSQTDGIHTFYVKARDNAGNNGTYGSHTFQIDKTPPSATIAYPTNGTTVISANVTFIAISTTDLSGITGYSWDFGDGANGTGLTITHRYTSSGTFAAKLTVTDGAGNKATSVTNITVPQNVIPEFSALTFLIVATTATLFVLCTKKGIQQK
jgi:hypothetical protein